MSRAAALLIGVLALVGCGGSGDHNARALAALEQARTLHLRAGAATAHKDTAGALEALEAVTKLRFPPGAPEAEDVALDALVQMSRILLAAGRHAEAETTARRAIARGTRDSFFLGLAYLRLGDALRARGQKRAAVDAFERSIAINSAVLKKLGRKGQ